MKAVKLDPNEIEYCSTLDWDGLMRYLKNKYGIEFQERFQEQLRSKMQEKMQLTEDEKEKLK
jgi:hypothetical protein